MRPRVVIVYGGRGDTAIEEEILRAVDAEVIHVDGRGTSDELVAVAAGCDALMVGTNPVTAELIAAMERCRIICRVGTGVDAIDIPAATARSIWVTNVPDYSIDEVSTHAIALVLALARHLFPHRDAARAGDWRYFAATPIRRFAGRTLGVVGLGRIGRASARKALGLGLNVVACDPYLDDMVFATNGVRRVDLPTLLQESDFVTLHVPLSAETRRLIDGAALAMMKPTAYLVNTARGEVVDTAALLAALDAGQLTGAALDVLPLEPPPPDSPLLRHPRIIITPHIAWASTEAGRDVKIRGAEEVGRVLRGERPRYPLNEVTTPRTPR
jgi:D-3-phosphoglycerate dehydrogenase